MPAVILVSSACASGSLGAGSGIVVSFSSVNCHRTSSGTATSSKRVAPLASAIVAPMKAAVASAESCCVSSVMKFDAIH